MGAAPPLATALVSSHHHDGAPPLSCTLGRLPDLEGLASYDGLIGHADMETFVTGYRTWLALPGSIRHDVGVLHRETFWAPASQGIESVGNYAHRRWLATQAQLVTCEVIRARPPGGTAIQQAQ
ncbi:hypothetical protein C8J57DRAFT_1534893 [Mycena rebaudengoi]|nr:hypothetical protein C8J57DRAFT_1534893 [Mycena rebaudengoi]